jgi:hypothetical protein
MSLNMYEGDRIHNPFTNQCKDAKRLMDGTISNTNNYNYYDDDSVNPSRDAIYCPIIIMIMTIFHF